MFEEHMKVKEDFKARVKGLPLAERKRAAMLYTLFSQIVDIEREQQKMHDTAYEEYSGQINAVTQHSDEIVEGLRKVQPDEADAWREHGEPNFVLDEAANDGAPLRGFWKEYILNSGVCGLKRQRRKGRRDPRTPRAHGNLDACGKRRAARPKGDHLRLHLLAQRVL